MAIEIAIAFVLATVPEPSKLVGHISLDKKVEAVLDVFVCGEINVFEAYTLGTSIATVLSPPALLAAVMITASGPTPFATIPGSHECWQATKWCTFCEDDDGEDCDDHDDEDDNDDDDDDGHDV